MSAVEQVELPVEEPQWTLGDRLYKGRKAAKLTGEQMAQKLSAILGKPISKQTVSNWENDVNQPRELFRIIDAWASLCPDEFTPGWFLTQRRCSCESPQVRRGDVCGECGGVVVRGMPAHRYPELPFATQRARLAAVRQQPLASSL